MNIQGSRFQSNVCTLSGCTFVPQNSSCGDLISCTDTWCDAHLDCQMTLNDAVCADSHNCTVDFCDATLDCQNIPTDFLCTDGISCTADVCGADGECTNTPTSSRCEDGFTCSVDTCDPLHSESPSGCTSNFTNCSWKNPDHDNCIDCQSSHTHLVELSTDGAPGATLEIRTASTWGSMNTQASFISTDQIIFGGSLRDTDVGADDGVILKVPVRLVPVDHVEECNEIRRGTMAVVEEPFDCGNGRTCHRDVLTVCVLGSTTYEWQAL